MFVTPLGTVTDVSPANLNAFVSIFVTLDGMLIVCKLVQCSNKLLEISASWQPGAKSTWLRLVQPENAYVLMEVTLLGMVTFCNDMQCWNAPAPIVVIPSLMLILCNCLQLENTEYANSVTPLGMLIVFSDSQLLNAISPIFVTVCGMLTFSNLAQRLNV